MYLKKFKNKHAGFLIVTCHVILEYLINQYGKINITDLEAKNQQMNDPIKSSLKIENYFKSIDD